MPFFYSELHDPKRASLASNSAEGESKHDFSRMPLFGRHMTLTLDEYCKPSLSRRSLEQRNGDQVLIRYQDIRGDRESLSPARLKKVLAVHQAWIWKVGEYVITSFPAEHEVKVWMEDEGLFSDFSGLRSSNGHEAHVCFLLSHIIDFFDRAKKSGLSKPPERILDIFERSIVELSDRVRAYTQSATVTALDMKKELQLYHEIEDIREELNMIRSVLVQQEEIWRQFASQALSSRWLNDSLVPTELDVRDDEGVEFWRKATRPQVQFPKFFSRIDQLDRDAQRVESSISVRLDVQAKHASIRHADALETEAEQRRKEADRQAAAKDEEAHAQAVMNTAIFGFTIVTIIFTPLSFLLAVFALPMKRFSEHQVQVRRANVTDATYMYPTHYIGKWIGESRGLL